MRKKLIILLIMPIIAFTYFGCDKIDAPYREEVVAPDFCATGIDDSIPNKKVLVEDYTGHACSNCPKAGIYLNDSLKAIYNHCLVVISVHAGYFAGVCPGAFVCNSMPNTPAGSFTTDFNTTTGTTWNTFFGITGNPKGMVDRIDFPTSTHSKTYNAWGTAIASELSKDAKAKITITNTFSNNTVNVSVGSEFLSNVSGDHKLQVVLTEDSVIDWQYWSPHTPDVYEPNYLHRHVLRGSLNGDWGDLIASGNTSKGTSVTKTYNYSIPANVLNVDHCHIVAFIYDDATKEVLQVEEASVK